MKATASDKPPELIYSTDVAEMLDVTPQRVRQLARHADFPAPAAILGGGMRVWRRSDIERWRDTADRTPGRRRAKT